MNLKDMIENTVRVHAYAVTGNANFLKGDTVNNVQKVREALNFGLRFVPDRDEPVMTSAIYSLSEYEHEFREALDALELQYKFSDSQANQAYEVLKKHGRLK